MKTIVRITVLVLILAVMVPFVAVNAQDGGQGDNALAPQAAAVYFLSASSGSFADNGDGTYALTLDGVGENIVFIQSAPSLALNTQSNVNLTDQWAAAEGLTADAVLEIGDLNIVLTLTGPALDAGMQSFVATVGDIVSLSGAKGPELPMAFDAANLSIAWTPDFQNGLVNGIVAMYEGMRATPEECAAAKATWDEYWAWFITKQTDLSKYSTECYLQQIAASCTLANQVNAEIWARYATVSYLPTYLNTECKK